ncbi:MAG: DNA-directed RNA polymerase subunit alpha [Spirochaetaceae bacterium]|jgi:DNA-directed RNA polymerase subunit alpha|nr:DNA-directed RNA polymerase subunit alpha [Spirochaetaceae bacterium]
MARRNLLKGFKKPKSKTFETSELRKDYGKFIASPFEPGFGTTIGNTLRRVLLSSIQGYAVTALRIVSYGAEGTAHNISSEFELIPNVVEDTLEVINRLKQICFKLPDDLEQDTIMFEWSGKNVIKSENFAKAGRAEVLNPGLTIMTLTEGAHIEMELQIELGRGYIPSEQNAQHIDVIGTIPMDSFFSPVKKVKYAVEPARVGQRNDYDKLIFELWTNGTIEPENALIEAAKIAKEHFALFVNFDETSFGDDEELDEGDERIRQLMNTPVEELELSIRSSNCLKVANIKTIGELVRKTEDDINQTRNFGKKSLQEIKEKLQEWGLTLGITSTSELKSALKIGVKKDNGNEA